MGCAVFLNALLSKMAKYHAIAPRAKILYLKEHWAINVIPSFTLLYFNIRWGWDDKREIIR